MVEKESIDENDGFREPHATRPTVILPLCVEIVFSNYSHNNFFQKEERTHPVLLAAAEQGEKVFSVAEADLLLGERERARLAELTENEGAETVIRRVLLSKGERVIC